MLASYLVFLGLGVHFGHRWSRWRQGGSVFQHAARKFPTCYGMDGSGKDPGSPKISVLWRREIPGSMCNMEAVERYLFDTFALNKLRKRRRGFRVFLESLAQICLLGQCYQYSRKTVSSLEKDLSWNKALFMEYFCVSPGSFGMTVDSRKSLKGFLHWKSPPEGWL